MRACSTSSSVFKGASAARGARPWTTRRMAGRTTISRMRWRGHRCWCIGSRRRKSRDRGRSAGSDDEEGRAMWKLFARKAEDPAVRAAREQAKQERVMRDERERAAKAWQARQEAEEQSRIAAAHAAAMAPFERGELCDGVGFPSTGERRELREGEPHPLFRWRTW